MLASKLLQDFRKHQNHTGVGDAEHELALRLFLSFLMHVKRLSDGHLVMDLTEEQMMKMWFDLEPK